MIGTVLYIMVAKRLFIWLRIKMLSQLMYSASGVAAYSFSGRINVLNRALWEGSCMFSWISWMTWSHFAFSSGV